MRDADDRAAAHGVLQQLLNGHLRLGVNRRRRLVQQQDFGLLQDDAQQPDDLPLAARQLAAVLADARVQAVLELREGIR